MSLTGFNVDPDSSEPTVGIEINYNGDKPVLDKEGRPTAVIYINEEECPLTYEETRELARQALQTARQLAWKMARWATASDMPKGKIHLLRCSVCKAGETLGQKTTLCGRTSQRYSGSQWGLNPLLTPLENNALGCFCQQCFAAYQKAEEQQKEGSEQ